MKKWPSINLKAPNNKVLLFSLLFLCLFACTTMYSENDLYGIWAGSNEDLEIMIDFKHDSTCELVYNRIGSRTNTITGNFESNFSKQPIPLTIRNIPQLNYPLHTIIEFKSLDVIKMAEFAPRWRVRPISFNRDTEIILKRRDSIPGPVK